MKRKGKLLFILLFLSVLCVQAQYLRPPKKKIFSIDVGVEYDLMITKPFSDGKYDKQSKHIATTDVFALFNLKVYKDFGVWASYAWSFGKNSDILDERSILNEIVFDYTNYFIENTRGNSSLDIGGGIGLGFFYTFNKGKWTLTPMMGVTAAYNSIELSYRVKEKGSNQAYIVDYYFGAQGDDMQNYLNAQMKINYKLSNKIKLLMGVKFNHGLNRQTLETRITDYYDYSLIYETKKKSRLINTLGISAGLSF